MRRRIRDGVVHTGNNGNPNTLLARVAIIPFLIVTLLFVVFGLFFAGTSSSMGAPWIFPIFGIGFTIVAISMFLVGLLGMFAPRTPSNTAGQPQDTDQVLNPPESAPMSEQETRACTYCGTRVEVSVDRCPNCGAGV